MKIGITERGDAGLDFTWAKKIDQIDGAILITKNLNPQFQKLVFENANKVIIHATITGYGGTELEPCVPTAELSFKWLDDLLKAGFPANRIVLRIDPIFPTNKGLKKVEEVSELLRKLMDSHNLNTFRIRASVFDQYPHVKERFAQKSWSIYDGKFQASNEQFKAVGITLNGVANKCNTTIEVCAENNLAQYEGITIQGCISNKDLKILNIQPDKSATINPQNRGGCHCLSCKTELLENKCRCGHKCLYCYWKG